MDTPPLLLGSIFASSGRRADRRDLGPRQWCSPHHYADVARPILVVKPQTQDVLPARVELDLDVGVIVLAPDPSAAWFFINVIGIHYSSSIIMTFRLVAAMQFPIGSRTKPYTVPGRVTPWAPTKSKTSESSSCSTGTK